ncbi:hypothetical protein DIPPA_28365 [Diplonema papillatum]|nr:hypothetical protein DIPPA_28365 [Diplonema papillatum]
MRRAPTPPVRGRSDSRGRTGKSAGKRSASRGGDGGTGISVYGRMRPAGPGEVTTGECMRAVKLLPNRKTVYVRDHFVEEREFSFCEMLSPEDTQEQVFKSVGTPVVDAALAGKQGTVLVYGQTGTGKTYTAFNTETSEEGLLVKSVQEVFRRLDLEAGDYDSRVGVQFFQLYNDALQDLLPADSTSNASSNDLSMRVDESFGTAVSGMSVHEVDSAAEALALFQTGTQMRTVRLTTMNTRSSRSHAMFLVSIRRVKKQQRPPTQYSVGEPVLTGRLLIVDLAGSERIKRTNANGVQKVEAQAINKSLACLGNVIHALGADSAGHIPYRDSKLTRLLKHFLSSAGQASVIVTFSPALADITETVSSLQFGQRALKAQQRWGGGGAAVGFKRTPSPSAAESHRAVRALQERVTTLERELRAVRAEKRAVVDSARQMQRAHDDDERLIDDLERHLRLCTAENDRLRGEVRAGGPPDRASSSRSGEDESSGKRHLQADHEEQMSSALLCHAGEIESMRQLVEEQEKQHRAEISALTAEKEAAEDKLRGFEAAADVEEAMGGAGDDASSTRLENEELKAELLATVRTVEQLRHELEDLRGAAAASQKELQDEVQALTSDVITARSDVEARAKEVHHLRHHVTNMAKSQSLEPATRCRSLSQDIAAALRETCAEEAPYGTPPHPAARRQSASRPALGPPQLQQQQQQQQQQPHPKQSDPGPRVLTYEFDADTPAGDEPAALRFAHAAPLLQLPPPPQRQAAPPRDPQRTPGEASTPAADSSFASPPPREPVAAAAPGPRCASSSSSSGGGRASAEPVIPAFLQGSFAGRPLAPSTPEAQRRLEKEAAQSFAWSAAASQLPLPRLQGSKSFGMGVAPKRVPLGPLPLHNTQ